MTTNFTDVRVNGTLVRVELLDVLNIDTVVSTEALVAGNEIFTGNQDVGRRVDRTVRDLLIRFGVDR